MGVRVALGAVAGTVGGPATYAVELLRALARAFPDDEYTVLSDRPEFFPDAAARVHLPLRSTWYQPYWDHVALARALAKGNFDLYHGTKGVLPRRLRIPAVVTVHDLAHRVVPETFSRAQRCHLGLETAPTLRRAGAVITDSQHSAADLRRLFPAASAKVESIPLGVPAWARKATTVEVESWMSARGLRGPCIGYLGTVQPRKNLDVLAQAFTKAAAGRPWRLLVAGRLRPGYRPACLEGGDSRITYLGVLPQDELPAFLGAVACMVSPSSYEGFGLSLLEAMACGCPVVGLNNSSVPEVVGDAGILVEQRGGNGLSDRLAAAIVKIVSRDDEARRLSAAGLQRASRFSWDKTARLTRAVYARCVEGKT
ncbi:MAG: glycosyltransferase family 1 protein [Deltaproteobacteria bacterium]